MLRELHITNLALIEDARIEFSDGLNCFTGQTGAGKSLILGAFELMLGLRSATDMLRAGADDGRVSGVFELKQASVASAIATLADQPIEVGEPLLITRKLHASGRTSVSVNGLPATAAMVKAIGEQLVDIHGQHDHQYLLKPANQLLILDTAAEAVALRDRFREVSSELRHMRQKRDELTKSRDLRRQQLELYEFQLQEIEDVDPQPREYIELKARSEVLANVDKLRHHSATAYAAMYEADGSIIERLQLVAQVLGDLQELDENLTEVTEAVRGSTVCLQDAAFELSRYSDRLDYDPAELAEVERRLNGLNRLVNKYGQVKSTSGTAASLEGYDPLEPVMKYRDEVRTKLHSLRTADEDFEQIEQHIAEHAVQLDAVGRQLTESRKQAATRLMPQIEKELKLLGMSEATLEADIVTKNGLDERGDATATHSELDASSSGFDTIEFLIRPNPGQPARPLRKIASGGELSRIMLALKSVLASHDRISVLVFDEIDANIGGRMGTVIGDKLRGLAKASHQVLCITHLPQIAAFADRHLRIEKTVAGKGKSRSTRTSVTELTGKARVDELAQMLAGSVATQTTRKQARELIDAAR